MNIPLTFFALDLERLTHLEDSIFKSGSDGKASACNAGDLGLIPGSGRSSGERNGNRLQYSHLENHMDKEPGRLQSMGLQESDMT